MDSLMDTNSNGTITEKKSSYEPLVSQIILSLFNCHFEVSSLDVIQQSDGNSCGKFVVYYLIMTYYLMNTDIYHPTNFIHLLGKKLVPDCINRLNISSHQPQPDETMKNVGNK